MHGRRSLVAGHPPAGGGIEARIGGYFKEGYELALDEVDRKGGLEVAQRGMVVETGRVRLAGTSAELARNPEIRAAYLGP